MKKVFLLLILLMSINNQAQNFKFGKVSKAEIAEKNHPLDSSANAAILYSNRLTSVTSSGMRTEYYERIKIYTKEGATWASKKIYLHLANNRREKTKGIKGYSWNIENGKVLKTKLEKNAVFLEHENKYLDIKKFTMPNIKAGTVIEYKYTVESPFLMSLDRVILQKSIPINKIDVQISIIEYLKYIAHRKGYLSIDIKKGSEMKSSHYNKSKTEVIASAYNTNIIHKENIPALKDEPYAGNINNYRSSIEYELQSFDFPQQPTKHFSTDWNSVSKTVYQSSDFGNQLLKRFYFEEDLKQAIAGATSTDDKILRILALVKQKIKWNEYYGKFTDKGTKKAYKDGVGNVADINLNLVTMLRKAGFDANPVLVSTINNGIPIYPTIAGFNYVIAHIKTVKGDILLDATEKYSMPNVLPTRVYNFQGMLIKDGGLYQWVELYPQTHANIKQSIRAKFDGEKFQGSSRRILDGNFLLDYREEMENKSEDAQITVLEGDFDDIEIDKIKINNLDDLSQNVIEAIQFTSENFFETIGNKIFISPMLFLQKKENLFKSETREFPIFYNKPWAKDATIYIAIPEGYTIESIPESETIVIPNSLGGFSYSITQQGQMIVLKTSTVINTAVVSMLSYQDLKDFYSKMIKKQAEKIVLVKK